MEQDVAGLIEALHSKGVEIITGVREVPPVPGAIFAEFLDSESNRIAIASTQQPAPAMEATQVRLPALIS